MSALPDHLLSPPAWAAHHAARRPGAPAVDGSGVRLTYRALWAAVAALAGELRATGFGPGRRLLVIPPHAPAGAVAILAAQAAGGSAVPLPRDLPDAALRSVVEQTGARHAVVDAAFAARADAWRAFTGVWLARREGGEATLFAPLHGSVPGAAPLDAPWGVEPGDEALVMFTSGSTGEPRGVLQTFANLRANSRSIVSYLGLGPEDRALAILPLSYCYGLSVLQTHLLVGGSIYLEPGARFARVLLDALARERCTGFPGVPITFELLRRDADVRGDQLGGLRYVTQAGGALARETARWVRQAFAPARLFVMYGQTEATARLAYLPPERAADKEGSIGVAIPGVELRVVGEDGAALPAGEAGELVACGENVTRGYLAAPAETAAVFRPDGLHTGDLGYRDADGFFWLTGRAREVMKVAGHRVSPVTVEHAVGAHPAVLEVAVTAVPDPVRGEAPAAFVVPRAGTSIDRRELLGFCRRALPPHLMPARLDFVDRLPRNGAGKLLRAELARMARG